MIKYDVVIVGAGPAGIIAGIELLRHSIPCCIIDRYSFPRDKICGGVLTKKAIDFLQTIGICDMKSSIQYKEVNEVTLLNKGRDVCSVTCQHNFTLVQRSDFDNWLLEKFKRLGGVFLGGYGVHKINVTQHIVSLNDDTEVKYNILIGADGATGISKNLQPKKQRYIYGVKASVKGAVSDIVLEATGRMYLPNNDSTDIFYLTSKCRQCKEVCAPFPYGSDTFSSQDDVLYVGDAGGFVDHLTGEGIYLAMYTGFLAARSILNRHAYPAKEYRKRVGKIRRQVWMSWHVSAILHKHRDQFVKLLKEHPELLKFLCDNLVSMQPYGYNLPKLLIEYQAQNSVYIGFFTELISCLTKDEDPL